MPVETTSRVGVEFVSRNEEKFKAALRNLRVFAEKELNAISASHLAKDFDAATKAAKALAAETKKGAKERLAEDQSALKEKAEQEKRYAREAAAQEKRERQQRQRDLEQTFKEDQSALKEKAEQEKRYAREAAAQEKRERQQRQRDLEQTFKEQARQQAEAQSAANKSAAKKSVHDAIAAEERKLADLKSYLRNKDGSENKVHVDRMIALQKGYQDRVKVIDNLIGQEKDKDRLHELQEERKAIREKTRMQDAALRDTKAVQSGGKGAKVGLLGVGREIINQVPGGGALSGIMNAGGGMAGMAVAGASAGIGAAVMGFKAVIDVGSEFETKMAGLRAIVNPTKEQLALLTESTRTLGVQFGTGAAPQVDLFTGVLSRLGPQMADKPEALAKIASSINTLGIAGDLDPAEAMDALTTSLLQFGANVDDPIATAEMASKQMDAMAMSAQVGAAEISQVKDAVVVAGSALHSANVSFEESNAAIQVTAAASGKFGSEAGTGIRNVIGLMQKNSDAAVKQYEAMGGNFKHLGETLNTKGFAAALEEIKGPMSSLKTQAEKNAFVMQMFGTENASVATGLINNTDKIKEWTKEIGKSGAATQQAEIKQSTFAAKMDVAHAKLKDVALTIWNALQPALSAFGDVLGVIFDVLGWILKPIGWLLSMLGEMYKWQINLITSAVKWIANLGFVKDAIAAVIKIGKGIIDFFVNMGKSVGDAIGRVVTWFKNFYDNITNADSALRKKLEPALKIVRTVLNWVWTAIKDVASAIKERLMAAIDAVVRTMNWAWGALKTVGTWISDVFVGIWDNLTRAIGWVGDKFTWLKGPIDAVVGWIKDAIGWVKDAINDVGQFIGMAGEAEKKKPAAKTQAQQQPAKKPVAIVKVQEETPEEKAKREEEEQKKKEAEEKKKEKGTTQKEKKEKTPEDILKEKIDAINKEMDRETAKINRDLAQGLISEETAQEKRLAVTLEYNERIKKEAQSAGEIGVDIAIQSETAIADARRELRKIEHARLTKDAQDAFDKEQTTIRDQYKAGEIDARTAADRLRALQTQHNQEMLDLAKKYSADTKDIESAIETDRQQRFERTKENEQRDIADRYSLMRDAAEKDPDEGSRAVKMENLRFSEAKEKEIASVDTTDVDAAAALQRKLEEMETEHQTNLTAIKLEAEKKRNEATRAFLNDAYTAVEEGNAAQFALQQIGLDTSLSAIIKAKGIELAVWLWNEWQKTAATETGVMARLGLLAEEVGKTIWGAAVSTWGAITSAWEWITETVPWPFSLALIPAAAAAIWGAYEMFKPKETTELAEGGIATGPIFSPLMRGGAVAGEAGNEVIIPLSKLDSMLSTRSVDVARQTVARATDGATVLAASIRAAAKRQSDSIADLIDVVSGRQIVVLDGYGTKLGIMKADASRASRSL